MPTLNHEANEAVAALPDSVVAVSSAVAARDFLVPVCHHTIAAPTSAAATQRLAGLGQM